MRLVILATFQAGEAFFFCIVFQVNKLRDMQVHGLCRVIEQAKGVIKSKDWTFQVPFESLRFCSSVYCAL